MATRCVKAAGIELIHIPYRGGAPAVADAIGGQVSMVMDGANLNALDADRCNWPNHAAMVRW